MLPRAKRTINPPLGLATLAALCPRDWQVTIVDENLESRRESTLPEIRRWLARLARHGDRVSVFVAERWRVALPIDSSVFDVVLEPE